MSLTSSSSVLDWLLPQGQPLVGYFELLLQQPEGLSRPLIDLEERLWFVLGHWVLCSLKKWLYTVLGGCLNYFWFSPLHGEDFQFDSYFSDGLKPPTRKWLSTVVSFWVPICHPLVFFSLAPRLEGAGMSLHIYIYIHPKNPGIF